MENKKRKRGKINPSVIGFEIGKEFIDITHPGKIPIEFLENAIKENKKHPLKKNERRIHVGLIIPKNLFKVRGETISYNRQKTRRKIKFMRKKK